MQPDAGEIQVWRVRTEGVSPTAALIRSLSAEERARAARFARESDRRSYEISHGALRWILAEHLEEAPDRLRFTAGPWGKPALDGPLARSGVEFNLSHTAGLAIVAVAHSRRVGVDVEAARPISDILGIAARVQSEPDFRTLAALPPDRRTEAFWRMWTANEACLKARGLGLASGNHAVRLDPAGRPEPCDSSLMLRFLELPTPYVGALAADGLSPAAITMSDFRCGTES